MARDVVEKAETEGDFALGIGLGIAIFIALFATAIALFVLEQRKVHPPRSHAASPVAVPADAPAATSVEISE